MLDDDRAPRRRAIFEITFLGMRVIGRSARANRPRRGPVTALDRFQGAVLSLYFYKLLNIL